MSLAFSSPLVSTVPAPRLALADCKLPALLLDLVGVFGEVAKVPGLPILNAEPAEDAAVVFDEPYA